MVIVWIRLGKSLLSRSAYYAPAPPTHQAVRLLPPPRRPPGCHCPLTRPRQPLSHNSLPPLHSAPAVFNSLIRSTAATSITAFPFRRLQIARPSAFPVYIQSFFFFSRRGACSAFNAPGGHRPGTAGIGDRRALASEFAPAWLRAGTGHRAAPASAPPGHRRANSQSLPGR